VFTRLALGFSLVAKGLPGPQDVARGIDVRVIDVPAAGTSEVGGRAVRRIDLPTVMAGLGGVPGVDGDHLATSFFRFVADVSQQLSPARSEDFTVQPAFGGRPVRLEHSFLVRAWLRSSHQVPDLKVFVDDRAVPIDELPGDLMCEITSLVSDPAVHTSDLASGFATSI
jgi:hypothetical protein